MVCQKHWGMMREAVDVRGMSHLVAKDGRAAMENTVAQIEGRATEENWDPLMTAFWNMKTLGLNKCGLASLAEGFCILCEIQKSYDDLQAHPEKMESPDWPKGAVPRDAQGWIDSCMDAMLSHARDKGLVPRPS